MQCVTTMRKHGRFLMSPGKWDRQNYYFLSHKCHFLLCVRWNSFMSQFDHHTWFCILWLSLLGLPTYSLYKTWLIKNITARNEKKILLLLFVKNNYCTSKMLYRRNYKSSKKVHFFSSVMCMLQYTLHALYYCLHQKCFCKINMVLHSSAQTFWT